VVVSSAARSCCSAWVECPVHRGSVLRGHVREQEAVSLAGHVAWASGGTTVDLSELLIEYANVIVSRAVLATRARAGCLTTATPAIGRGKVFTDFRRKLIGTGWSGSCCRGWAGWMPSTG